MAENNEAALAMSAFVDHCERCVPGFRASGLPGFRAALRPVPEEELDRLLALTGLPAPPEYRAYLQTFGHAAAAFLYREAYARLRQPRLTHHRTLRADAGVGAPRSEGAAARRVDRFLELVHRLGFQSLPHLDALTPICERPDAVVSLFGEVEAEDTLFVDAHDEREANRIAEILADNLGARPFG